MILRHDQALGVVADPTEPRIGALDRLAAISEVMLWALHAWHLLQACDQRPLPEQPRDVVGQVDFVPSILVPSAKLIASELPAPRNSAKPDEVLRLEMHDPHDASLLVDRM